jgi:hypothetical protein
MESSQVAVVFGREDKSIASGMGRLYTCSGISAELVPIQYLQTYMASIEGAPVLQCLVNNDKENADLTQILMSAGTFDGIIPYWTSYVDFGSMVFEKIAGRDSKSLVCEGISLSSQEVLSLAARRSLGNLEGISNIPKRLFSMRGAVRGETAGEPQIVETCLELLERAVVSALKMEDLPDPWEIAPHIKISRSVKDATWRMLSLGRSRLRQYYDSHGSGQEKIKDCIDFCLYHSDRTYKATLHEHVTSARRWGASDVQILEALCRPYDDFEARFASRDLDHDSDRIYLFDVCTPEDWSRPRRIERGESIYSRILDDEKYKDVAFEERLRGQYIWIDLVNEEYVISDAADAKEKLIEMLFEGSDVVSDEEANSKIARRIYVRRIGMDSEQLLTPLPDSGHIKTA